MYITPEEIYSRTNGGLDIIKTLFPAADEKKKFKLRSTEKTPSASLKKIKDNIWILTDFGGDGKGHNAIELFMIEENCEFKEAVNKIAERFNISGSTTFTPVEFKPLFESRAAKKDEEEKKYFFRTKDFTKEELSELGRFVTEETCKKYGLHSLQTYTYIKDRKALTFSSTPDYPMFLWDHETWRKLYKPRETKKEFRFAHDGEKPKDFIFGLDDIEKEFLKKKKTEEKIELDESEMDSDHSDSENKTKKENKAKLDSIFLCSGERDALNLASLGKRVICLNSETATLSLEKYKQISSMCKTFYNVPDIDATGVIMGKRFALHFLNVHTVWFPEELTTKKDFRGNPCKDLADYLRHYDQYKFDKLVKDSLPLKFWLEIDLHDMKGRWKGIKYEINNVTLYEFLNANGFWKYESKNEECGYIYTHIENRIVDAITIKKSHLISSYVDDYMKALNYNVPLRNMVYRTSQLNESSLKKISYRNIDFKDFGHDFQYMFFKNKTWKITSNGIEEFNPDDVNVYVWRDELIDFNIKKMDEPFSVKQLPDGRYFIDIKDHDFIFMKYLVNTSRIYWRKQEEEKIQLTPDEEYEEMLHLINKVYVLGYLLHRYKNPSRPWMPFAVDAKESTLGESNGGTGKSILFNVPTFYMKYVPLNGRDKKLTENPHIFADVDENTDYIMVNDAEYYFDLHYFLSPASDNMNINPKHNKPYQIPFEKSPKISISSNHMPNKLDDSIERRLIYVVFSDYYHYLGNKGTYKESRSPFDEFGRNLFKDFTEEEWNKMHNFIAACIKVYLSFEKISPPMASVVRRNLRSEMGENLLDWANQYFEDPNNLNRFIERSTLFNEYQVAYSDKHMNTQRFKKKLHAFCNYKELIFNPADILTDVDNKRIMKKNDQGKTAEFFYVQKPGVALPQEDIEPVEPKQVKLNI